MRNTSDIRGLVVAARQLERASGDLERARVATSVRDLAEAIVARSIRAANDAGTAWRDIGDALDVPFATLYRRYGTRPS